MAKKATYLIIGIVVSILYVLFYTPLAEKAWTGDFKYLNDMYNSGVYTMMALITFGMAWGAAALYYYGINSVKFSRWYHWLCIFAVVVVLTPVICYMVNVNAFDSAGYSGYEGNAISFEMLNMVFTAVLFVIASYSIRWWSTNCRHTPIPQ